MTVEHVVKAGQEIAVLKSTKAAADICSPVSGDVLEIDEKLQEFFQGINQVAEINGWLFSIDFKDI